MPWAWLRAGRGEKGTVDTEVSGTLWNSVKWDESRAWAMLRRGRV